MFWLVVTAVLAADPAASKIKLAAPALSYANLDEKTGDFFLDALGQGLIKHGADVITQKEISAVVGLERQKQLIGCGDDQSSCLAELAGALGVDGIVTGSMAKTSGGFAVNLKIVASSSGKTLAAESTRVKSDDALLDWFEVGAKRLVDASRKALGKQPAVAKPEPLLPDPSAATPSTPSPASDAAAARPPSALEVLWNGRWYPARVVETRADGKVKIHYEGYSDVWDDWVSRARLRGELPPPPAAAPKPSAAGLAAGQLIEVEWNGSWYKAKVLEIRKADGHAFIQYDGYSASWNEWVPPARMRPLSAEE